MEKVYLMSIEDRAERRRDLFKTWAEEENKTVSVNNKHNEQSNSYSKNPDLKK